MELKRNYYMIDLYHCSNVTTSYVIFFLFDITIYVLAVYSTLIK